MDTKELLAQLAKFDEMEAQDGMNLLEDVEEENELADKKSKKRVYLAAVGAIEKLRDELEEGIDPATGKLDAETEDFFNKLGEIVDEIQSRSYAFDESLDEANTYTDNMLDGINVANKTINSDLEFNVQVKEVNGGVAFNANGTGVQYHPYKPVDHEASKEELADVVNRCAEVVENKINELEDEIIGIFNERGFRK